MRFFMILLAFLLIPASLAENGGEGAPPGESSNEAFFEAIMGLLTRGDAQLGRHSISLGESLTSLACRCKEDDSCDTALDTLCGGLDSVIPGTEAFLTPFASAASDPAAAMCVALHYGFEAPPIPDTGLLERPDAMPGDPLLSIEAVRWRESDQYRYALRYQLTTGSDFDDHENIRFEVRGTGAARSVITLASLPPIGSSSDLPLAASFGHDELFTRACIRFDEVPDDLPREFCTTITEVDR